jgi:death-on-curing protein
MTEPEKFNYIDVELMEKMCHPLAVAIFDTKEDPIVEFRDHELSLLDSALNSPAQTFGQKELYSSLPEKASIIYYNLIKNHPFKNGNKRIATATFLVFLYVNGYWLAGDKQEIEDYLVELAKRVASSSGSQNRNDFLQELNNWITVHITKKEK